MASQVVNMKHLLAIVLVLLATISTNVGGSPFGALQPLRTTSPSPSDPCNHHACNNDYLHQLNAMRGNRHPSIKEQDIFCDLLLSYNQCMKTQNKVCRGNLEYHTVTSLVQQMMKNYNCSGSHHKTRQGVKSHGVESFAHQRRQELEDKRLKRCHQQVFQFTFKETPWAVNQSTVRHQPPSSDPAIAIPMMPMRSSPSRGRRRKPRSDDDCDDRPMGDDPVSSGILHKLYDKESEPLLCSIFGDPHLRTFTNDFQTCRILGAWPLVDHPLFAVQVTNGRVTSSHAHGSAVTKVTILVRNFRVCGVDHDLVYEVDLDSTVAEDDNRIDGNFKMPVTFIDGTTSTMNGLVKVTPRSEDVVCIQLDHVGVQVCVSRLSDLNYLNVIVKFKKTMTLTEADMMTSAMTGLCIDGCPSRETINVESILEAVGISPHFPLNSNKSDILSMTSDSTELCNGLYGFYFTSCLFDVKMKGSSDKDISVHRHVQDMDDLLIVQRTFAEKTLAKSSLLTSASRSANLSPIILLMVIVRPLLS